MNKNVNVESDKRHRLFLLVGLLLVLFLVLFVTVKSVAQGNRSRRVVNPPQEPAKPPTPAEPQTIDVIKIDADLVNVPVIVSDRQGRYIPNLPVTSFKLFDNDTEQNIVHFEASEEPLNIALLLDTSRSTEAVLDDIKNAAMNFLKELRPQDRALILSFDYAIHRLSELTNDRKQLEKAIKKAKVGKYIGTTLNDAVAEIAEHDFKSVNGRKAIVLLSDGQDFGSEIPGSELLDHESESDTMVYSVFYKSNPVTRAGSMGNFPGGLRGILGARFPNQRPGAHRRRDRGLRGAEFLEQLSIVTSGRFYNSEVTDLDKTFALIADELRHQYKLGFYPQDMKKDGSLHQLRVKVEGSDIAVRARKQYRAQQ